MQFYDAVALIAGVALYWRLQAMQNEINRLRASIAAQATVIASAVAAFQGLSGQIRDNAEDPAALNSLADSIDASTASLAQAMASGTPASDEVHSDDGGTGSDDTAVDPGTVELAAPASEAPAGDQGGEAQE